MRSRRNCDHSEACGEKDNIPPWQEEPWELPLLLVAADGDPTFFLNLGGLDVLGLNCGDVTFVPLTTQYQDFSEAESGRVALHGGFGVVGRVWCKRQGRVP